MINIITIILIIILIISIIFSIKNNSKYFIIKSKYAQLENDLRNKYIKKNNIILQNAVFEAWVQANENNNTFEEKAYKELLNNLKNKNKIDKDTIN